MNLRKLTTASLLVAIGAVSSHLIHIPIGVSKVFPVQHSINMLSAVLFGPSYAVAIAFVISLIRNLLGTGSPLAFPGSMIGAFVAGVLYSKTKMPSLAAAGEVLGTGVLGGLVSYPIAKFLMGREVASFFFVTPFILSSLAGATIGYVIFNILLKTGITNSFKQ